MHTYILYKNIQPQARRLVMIKCLGVRQNMEGPDVKALNEEDIVDSINFLCSISKNIIYNG